jgi:spermidine synthase
MVLYSVVFVCGGALMGLELLAARVLAPVMGNSIFVWGSIIASFMIALSLGYWLGGRIADRYGAARSLGVVIGAAGLATALCPLAARATLAWAAELGTRTGPLIATTIIFFVPALMIAMVTPMGIRLVASAGLAHIGRSAGTLSAISTAGSIVGTLGTTFWLIPLLQVEPLIVGIGALLTATALASMGIRTEAEPGHAPHELGLKSTAAVVLLVIAGFAASTGVYLHVRAPATVNELGEQILYSADTQYHRITVTEKDGVRSLRFDKSWQSAISLEDGYTSVIRYPDYLHTALAVNPDAERVLILGLGGGATTKRMWRDYPDMRIDSVEIDPVVVDVAKRYFGLPEDERLNVVVEDARRYVQRTDETYDIVIVDAYYADSLPFHLTTAEFFTEISRVLRPGGVVAYNIISAVEGEESELFRSMYRTAGGVWDNLWVFPLFLGQDGDPQARRNIIMLATDGDVSETELRARLESRLDDRVSVPGFAQMGDDLYTKLIPVADVPELSDAFAPVDSLIKVQ